MAGRSYNGSMGQGMLSMAGNAAWGGDIGSLVLLAFMGAGPLACLVSRRMVPAGGWSS